MNDATPTLCTASSQACCRPISRLNPYLYRSRNFLSRLRSKPDRRSKPEVGHRADVQRTLIRYEPTRYDIALRTGLSRNSRYIDSSSVAGSTARVLFSREMADELFFAQVLWECEDGRIERLADWCWSRKDLAQNIWEMAPSQIA